MKFEKVMKPIKVLVLTDHSGHSAENSIYSLIREISLHPQCHSIYVASRGLKENNSFFFNSNRDALFGAKVGHDFEYNSKGSKYSEGLQQLNTKDFGLVFMRVPRPIPDSFLTWIEEIFNHAVIINKPSGIIETSNKSYLLNYPSLCPPMRLCNSIEEIKSFSKEFPIVLKPLRAYGGKGILKVTSGFVDDGRNNYPFEKFFSVSENFDPEGYLGMKYLKNVNEGDKRILVVGGEIMASSLRLPAEDSWLCNVAQGGRSVPSEVTNDEINIIEKINKDLIRKGILIYGVDTLTDDDGKRILSEINTLSIGGFPQAQSQSGRPIISQTIQKMFSYVNDSR